MKRYILVILIMLGVFLVLLLVSTLLALQLASAHASDLRDFRDTQELKTWIGQVYQNKPPLLLVADSTETIRWDYPLFNICVPFAEAWIKRANEQGYKAERYRITSPDYYKFWYNEDPYWQPNEAHGVVWVKVAGRTYLIEPSIPMAWELTVGWAGQKVGVAWE